MADLQAFIQQAPPISRVYAGLTFLLSLSANALGLIYPSTLVFWAPSVFNYSRPEIWRPLSSFMLTGSGMSIIMETYSANCETTKFSRPGDYLMFLIFCGAVILGLNHFLIGGVVYCRAMTMALAYYYSAMEDASHKVNFFIATFPIKFLPPVMLFITFIQGGVHPTLIEATGLIAAHLYLFLTKIWPQIGGGRDVIKTPQFIHNFFENAGAGRSATSGGVVNPGGPARPIPSPGQTTASGRNFDAPGSRQWTHRGQGHRLGS
ncbi:hypothetical protein RUND412_000394 [Rhizina undulata]